MVSALMVDVRTLWEVLSAFVNEATNQIRSARLVLVLTSCMEKILMFISKHLSVPEEG